MVTIQYITLPSGRQVRARAAGGNYSDLGFRAQSNGAITFSKSLEAQIGEPQCLDPFLNVSNPRTVRPWLFGNWWISAFKNNTTPQLIGVGVILGKGPAITQAEWNKPDSVELTGSYIRIGTDYNSPAAGYVPGKVRLFDQGSSAAFEKLEKMLKMCEKHSYCNSLVAVKSLPTRVLDVNPTRDPNYVSLFVSRGKPAQYLALSPCWGTSHRITNTKANIASHLRGIALANLPKTFTDAIEICRRLNIRYLWIDSLCIVQDDKDDWEAEASSMGSVYSNAYLTISALSSQDDSTGCFADFDARMKENYVSCDSRTIGRPSLPQASPLNHSIKDPAAPEAHVFATRLKFASVGVTPGRLGSSLYFTFEWMPPSLREKLRVHAIGEFGANFDPVADEPLSTRGWTLQERVLSPRIIHYANGEMFWECQSGIFAEDGAILQRQSVGMVDLMRLSPRNAHETWQKLVQDYTGRKLTRETDKLPALSGVAKVFWTSIGDKYVAGLWKHHIIQGLNWEVLTDEPSHNCDNHEHTAAMPPAFKHFYGYPKIYRAPSWSWASIDAKVHYGRLDTENILASCVDVQVQKLRNNPFGQVSSGWIKLKGYLTEIRSGSRAPEGKNCLHPYSVNVATEDADGTMTPGTAIFDSDAIFPCWAFWIDRESALILRLNPGPKATFTRVGRAKFHGSRRGLARAANSYGSAGGQRGPKERIVIVE